jgi:hypothetical protein
MGYLAAIIAILIHALANFLFYFAPIALLLGVYLARIEAPVEGVIQKKSRALKLAFFGYALPLGYLMFVLTASELLLGHAESIQHQLLKLHMPTFRKYEVAHALSRLDPFLLGPEQAMALELSGDMLMSDSNHAALRAEMVAHYERIMQLAPCFLAPGNEALELLHAEPLNKASIMQAERIVKRNLMCNPRHGLSYYHAGWFAMQRSPDLARRWWQMGFAAVTTEAERLLLLTALMAHAPTEPCGNLSTMEADLAFDLKKREGFPFFMGKTPERIAALQKLETMCGREALVRAVADRF